MTENKKENRKKFLFDLGKILSGLVVLKFFSFKFIFKDNPKTEFQIQKNKHSISRKVK